MKVSWYPREGRRTFGKDLKPGMLVAIDYAGFRHKPWRLHEISERDDRFRLILRPDGEQYDLAQFNKGISMGAYANVRVLNEHYSVCSKCGELPPCGEVWAEGISADVAEMSARYEIEGICPACQETITARQKSYRFEENLHVPLGPPVTFHKRLRCWRSAVQYDQVLANKRGTDPTLSCTGLSVYHVDDVRECTNATCPGNDAEHRNYARCYALDAECTRPECWIN